MCLDRCVEDGGGTAVQTGCLSVGSSRDTRRAQEVQQGVHVCYHCRTEAKLTLAPRTVCGVSVGAAAAHVVEC